MYMYVQYTNEQEEHLRPITTVLKTVDRVKTKLDAISEEIEGIEKVHTLTDTDTFHCCYQAYEHPLFHL